MFTGKTKNLAVIGNPIEHSLSPAMQNAAIEKAALDYAYIALRVEESDLNEAVAGFKALNFCGFNVTIPHKTAIIEFLDEITEDALIIGAVNTVKNDGGKLIGYNTDYIGFIEGLKSKKFCAENKNAILLGAGGAARAVIWGLIKEKIKSVNIGVRNPQKAKSLVAEFEKYTDIKCFEFADKEFEDKLSKADLIVNTTPLGMYPKIDEMPPLNFEKLSDKVLIYDIIYSPEKTKLLIEAEKHGHDIVNGEIMLAGQGAAALKLWTGTEPDIAHMQSVLRSSLSKG